MISAIRDDNPVMYFLHKGLMGLGWMKSPESAVTPVPEEPHTIPFGQADVKREGRDVTIVAVALMVHRALEAAARLEAEGIQTEVVDLRTLVPLDRATVLASVRKTGRLLVVDEDYRSFGLTGEIAAVLAEEAPKPFGRPSGGSPCRTSPSPTAGPWRPSAFPARTPSQTRPAPWSPEPMPYSFVLPTLQDRAEEGVVVAWFKRGSRRKEPRWSRGSRWWRSRWKR